MKTLVTILTLILGATTVWGQQTYTLPSRVVNANATDQYNMQNGVKTITDVVNPSIEVYLPAKDKANGCAVILCPGGALRVLSWLEENFSLLVKHLCFTLSKLAVSTFC